ncbi:MAG: hypothetical protein IKA88_01125 [Clostridia bacterium]|nr:hypothetical protein [Clostridia bacterium]
MSTQLVVDRILSDAAAEAETIVKEAENKAQNLRAEASARAESAKIATETELQAKRESIFEKKRASARLDGAKILLGEKRKTLDAIYAMALSRLQTLEKEDCLRLTARLLEAYAETGDEIFFAENFAYVEAAAKLPIVGQKSLKIAEERLPIDGGMRLKGAKADKDLSYGALLAADRDENQAALAAKLFK